MGASHFPNLLLAPSVAQALQGGLAWNFQSTEYTGIVTSNQQLVSCDSSFNLAMPPCSWIRIAFMGAPESSIGFEVMVHFALHSSLIS